MTRVKIPCICSRLVPFSKPKYGDSAPRTSEGFDSPCGSEKGTSEGFKSVHNSRTPTVPHKMEKCAEQEDWSCFVRTELQYILDDDDTDSFIDKMNSLPYKLEVFPTELMTSIIRFGANKIGTAVLNGETCLKPMNVNAVHPRHPIPLLHTAACVYNYDMVVALMNRGARTDLRCNREKQYIDGMIPLNVAVHCFCTIDEFVNKWTPKDSLFNLVIRLSNPFRTRNKLRVARLLFWNTEGIEYEIYRYAKEGKVLELAVLLLVAPKKVLSPSIFENMTNFSCPHGNTTLRQYITSEIASLTTLRTRLVHEIGSYALLQKCNDKLAKMKSMLMLLELFERAGDKITAYIQQKPDSDGERVRKIAWLIEESGFVLDYADLDMEYRSMMKPLCPAQNRIDYAIACETNKEKSLNLRLPDCMEPSDVHLCAKKQKEDWKLWNLTVKQDGKLLSVKKPVTWKFCRHEG
ncbi:Ankyrin-3 [Quillaja saponaria]|uniref:Ankyrin-3 n=1 Tax=Quillaja saponaria TaxID=32244 RepID=A0AAD7PWC0_QUISA|nr:Ankyrin-3 [Quillaja saponaria]